MTFSGEPLSMWVIYDHPLDYPTEFVARRHEVDTAHRVTDDVITADTIDDLRELFTDRGLYCILRSDGDDPYIVETWL